MELNYYRVSNQTLCSGVEAIAATLFPSYLEKFNKPLSQVTSLVSSKHILKLWCLDKTLTQFLFSAHWKVSTDS